MYDPECSSLGLTYAKWLGHRRNTGFMLDAQHHFAGKLRGWSPCTNVKIADENWRGKLLQFTDSLVQGRCCLLVLGGESQRTGRDRRPIVILSLRCTTLAWLIRILTSMRIITGLGASTGTGVESSPPDFCLLQIMFSCRSQAGCDFIQQWVPLVIINQKAYCLRRLEHLPRVPAQNDNQGYKNAPACARIPSSCPHFPVRLADGLEQDQVGVTVVFPRHTAHLLRKNP